MNIYMYNYLQFMLYTPFYEMTLREHVKLHCVAGHYISILEKQTLPCNMRRA